MADLETVRKRLAKYILSSGHTFREISLKIGRKDSYIQQYVKYGFPKRLNEVDRKKICSLLGIDETELVDDELVKNGVRHFLTADIAEEEVGVVDICALEAGLPIGMRVAGRMTVNDRLFDDWFGNEPQQIKFIYMEGDSMEPTLRRGSFAICDTGVKHYVGDGLYMVFVNGIALVKRVQDMADGTMLLKSDNQAYSDIVVKNNELEIFGRIVSALNRVWF